MIENEIRDKLGNLSKRIPDFIDTTNDTAYNVFISISHIIKIFRLCIIKDMLNSKRIDEISVEYFSTLLRIYNLDQTLYKTTCEYIAVIYQKVIEELEDEGLYEAAYNLYHMVTPGALGSLDKEETYIEK